MKSTPLLPFVTLPYCVTLLRWLLLGVVLMVSSRLVLADQARESVITLPVSELQHALRALESASREHQPLDARLADIRGHFQQLDHYVDALLYLQAVPDNVPATRHLWLNGTKQTPLPSTDANTREKLVAYRRSVAAIVYDKNPEKPGEHLQEQVSTAIRIGETLQTLPAEIRTNSQSQQDEITTR